MRKSEADVSLQQFINLVHELTGITIPVSRSSLIDSRLKKRLLSLHIQSYQEYLDLVKMDRSEQARFIDLVTTNETYFYRTPRIWDYIENKLLPNWSAVHKGQVFTAWSAASSSGEEAHLLGILCQEHKHKNPSFSYQVLGTDISGKMVERCQKGVYSGRSIESFQKAKPELFKKYMVPQSEGVYQVSNEVKRSLKFQEHNLFQPLNQNSKFDLVLLRNVLIYFTGPDQEKVLSLIEPKISSNGVLIIGESESLLPIKTHFSPLDNLIYQPVAALKKAVA